MKIRTRLTFPFTKLIFIVINFTYCLYGLANLYDVGIFMQRT